MNKKRILIAHPRVSGQGGSNGVAAWALQALRDHAELSLATLQDPDYDAINRNWGTSLHRGDFRVHLAPDSYHRLLGTLPTHGALLEACLTTRLAQNLDRQQHYDVLLGTQNEADFGRRGIHYVHHPWLYLPRPENEMRWYHRVPGALRSYRLLCRTISRATDVGLRRNLAIANSAFIADRIRAALDVDSIVIHPPVTTNFPSVPWQRRRRAAVAVGRIHTSKRWELAVAIVDEVRRRGYDLGLTLIGHRDDPEYQRRIEALAASRPWFRIHLNLPRAELAEALAEHRYGIHTMENEHFGMGPAEIVRAGCLLFAHNSGGPVEIVGAHPHLLFEGVEDAADRFERVLSDPDHEKALLAGLEPQRSRFSTDAFCKSLRDLVDRFP